MDRENIANNIIRNYKNVQNYLQGDPGVEGFVNTLSDLENNISDYLIETLKEKYGESFEKSNIYQKSIKGKNSKYIDDKRVEGLITKKILGKKISIESLLEEGIQKIKELFNTQKSFRDALKSGKIQCIELNNTILPTDNLPPPITGSNKGTEKKELSQNKLWLLIDTLRELGIYDDDLLFYIGKVDENMVRENTYYAIFIPRINKTIFINIGYGEASFICEGEISIGEMTSYGKEKLQSELGAKKIIFSENDIGGRKNKLTNFLLGKEGKPGEKVNVTEMRNRIINLEKLKAFYDIHKDDTFTDFDGEIAHFKDLFSKQRYYGKNYGRINKIYNINLPSRPDIAYEITWNQFKNKVTGKEFNEKKVIINLEELKTFYDQHKDDTFIDSNDDEKKFKDLFKTETYYTENYELANEKFNINLPYRPDKQYGMTWNQFKEILKIKKLNKRTIGLKELKAFYDVHKDDTFTDSNNDEKKFKDLFSSIIYYTENYELANEKFNINLPGVPYKQYKMKWNELKRELGIEEIFEIQSEIIGLKELKTFYDQHKDDTFTDSSGEEKKFKDLFSKIIYYRKNYELANEKFNINLPGVPYTQYKIKWKELQIYLWKK